MNRYEPPSAIAPTVTAHLRYRPDVDGLRAVAVLGVIVFHAAPTRLPGGFAGVDVFFVISGFLISGLILQGVEVGSWSFWSFYGRRIRRIFPALILVMTATLLMGWLFLLPDEYADLGLNVIGGALFFSNLLLWAQMGYFDAAASDKPLLHLWSLGVEEQFYLLWPAALVVLWRLRGWRIPLVAGLALISFAISVWCARNFPTAGFYSPLSRFWELLLGALLAMICLNPRYAELAPRPAVRSLVALCGLVLIVGSFVLLSKESAFPGAAALAPTFGAAMLIAAGPHGWINQKLLSCRWIIFIGLISYPLYLWHWPLLSYISIYGPSNADQLRLLKVAALVAAFIAAMLTYVLLEMPLRKCRLRKVAVNLSAAMLVCALLGAAAFALGGAPQRFSDAERSLLTQLKVEKTAFDNVLRPGCFLYRTAEFAQSCGSSGKSPILVWGDSHAAGLFHGLSAFVGEPERDLALFTTAGCPPILQLQSGIFKSCPEINQTVLNWIGGAKPHAVVLSGNWLLYRRPEFVVRAKETIRRVKMLGVKVIVVGPAVAYHKSQVSYLVSQHSTDPAVMNDLLSDLRAVDATLSKAAAEEGVAYVSPVSELCSTSTCLVLIPGMTPPRLFSFDYGHLTRDGSKFYARQFLAPALGLDIQK